MMNSFVSDLDAPSLKSIKRQNNEPMTVRRHDISLRSLGGQWCGSVGRVFAYDIRGPWFEFSHRQTLI